jgi:putative endonuclease
MKKRWYVYILKMADNSLYTGVTIDLKKRLKSHASGKGSKYVRSKLPIKEVYMGEVMTKSEALKKEYAIKQLKKENKIKTLLGES